MSERDDPFPPDRNRVHHKVERLARADPNAVDLSNRVAGTSEATAALFHSGKTPSSPDDQDPKLREEEGIA
jgi:hypothetical protein